MALKDKKQNQKNTTNSIELNAITTIFRHTTAAKKTQSNFQKGQKCKDNVNRKNFDSMICCSSQNQN